MDAFWAWNNTAQNRGRRFVNVRKRRDENEKGCSGKEFPRRALKNMISKKICVTEKCKGGLQTMRRKNET